MAAVLSLEEFVHVLANPESFALKEMVWYAINASTELVDEHADYALQRRLGTSAAHLAALVQAWCSPSSAKPFLDMKQSIILKELQRVRRAGAPPLQLATSSTREWVASEGGGRTMLSVRYAAALTRPRTSAFTRLSRSRPAQVDLLRRNGGAGEAARPAQAVRAGEAERGLGLVAGTRAMARGEGRGLDRAGGCGAGSRWSGRKVGGAGSCGAGGGAGGCEARCAGKDAAGGEAGSDGDGPPRVSAGHARAAGADGARAARGAA